MRLTQYLTEFQDTESQTKSRVKKIDKTKAQDLLKSKCKKAVVDFLTHGVHIQRYANDARNSEYGFLDSSNLPPRLSRNSQNYYTLIINDDPSWKGYPKRQIIGTIRKNNMETSSGLWHIFPFDGVKVGIVPGDDIWDSFSNLRSEVGIMARRYNEFISMMLNYGNTNNNRTFDKRLAEFKQACKNTDQWIADNDGIENIVKEKFLNLIGEESLNSYNGDYYKSILHYYNPKGFNVSTPGSMTGKDGSEVWLDGPAVYLNSIISLETIQSIMGYSA
jgi:hypothetical protein